MKRKSKKMRRSFAVLMLGLSVMMLSSCTKLREVHYYKDNAPYPSNYYRLKIKGGTFLTAKTRYISGYFDERAVEKYFNEFVQPKEGKLLNYDASEHNQNDAQTKEPVKEVGPVGEGFEGKKLVLILSSNSDAIAAQISNIAENDELMSSVVGLIKKTDLEKASEVNADLKTFNAQQASIVRLGESMINGMDENVDEQTANANLLAVFNAIAVELGVQYTFRNLEEAKNWFEQNQSLISK